MFTTISAVVLAGVFAASSAAYGALAQKRATAFENPASGGGSMFVDTLNGLGEPLNVNRPQALSHMPDSAD